MVAEIPTWPLMMSLPSLPLPNLQKGWAKGCRHDFLDTSLITYKDKKSISTKKVTEYATTTAVNDYFKPFYWALPLNQDPQPDDPLPVTDDALSEAELAVKAAIIKQMSNAIPKWLDYHTTKTTALTMLTKKQLTRDPVALFLSRLNGLEGPRLRSLTAKQLFSKENDDIKRRFEVSWATQSGMEKEWPAAHAAFVSAEFEKLLPHEQEKWVLAAEEAAKVNQKNKNAAHSEPALLPPVEAQRVIDNLGIFMGPLLEGIATMIGCKISLAVVGPEPRRGGQVNIIGIHEGVDKSPVPCRFDEGGGEKYKLWLAALGEWGMSCYTPEEQKARSLPGVSVPSNAPSFLLANAPWRQSSIESSKSAAIPDEGGPSPEQDESDAEEDSAAKKPAKKKKKGKGKGKKRMKDATKDEMEESNCPEKHHKGSEKENLPDPAATNPTQPSSVREVSEDGLPVNRANRLSRLHPLMPDDTNQIDPSLLIDGMAPGSRIPNCGPLDCPNPFESCVTSPPAPPPYMNPCTWPPWFTAARTYLVRFKLGDCWDRVVEALTVIEGQQDFKKVGKPLLQTNRPEPVSLWIQNARVCDPTPLGDRKEFTEAWWQWWRNMQPASRGLGEGEGPVPVDSRQDDGEWDLMDKPGQNGLYSVVTSLGWWGECVQQNSTAHEEWNLALDDVCWAFECLAAISME